MTLAALGALPACETGGEAAQAATPPERRGQTSPDRPHDHAKARGTGPTKHAHQAPNPRRESRWVLLQQWVRGAGVNREPTTSPPEGEAQLAERGRELFGMYCVNCHGAEGRGDGPRSNVFDPPPRDLAKGVFKFRSTPSGSPPAPDDLFRTISGGLRGTGMMPFVDLPEDERWALVAFVRKLSGRNARQAEALQPVPAPDDVSSRVRIARGRKAYEKLGCSSCHGPRGRGDGPAAPTLRDDAGRPIRALDFATKPLKRGDDPADQLLTLVTGLDGTPMPSYAGTASDRDLQDVVAYVLSLRTARFAIDARDQEETGRLAQGQYAQAVHTVVGGCGCSHGQ
ncbi:MAG: cytochrome c [Deltaproteobacteria bacterium]|nr:cytochrome c [Deltaproteobacteria bacterium]